MTKSKYVLKKILFALGLGLASCSQGAVETGLNPQRVVDVDEAHVEQLRNLIIEASEEPSARLFQGNPETVTLIDVAVAFALLQQPNASASDLVATVNLLTGANITELSPTPAVGDIAAFVAPPGSLDLLDVAILFSKLQQPNAGTNELATLVSNLTGTTVVPVDILIVPGDGDITTSTLVTTLADEDGENPNTCSLREAITANNTASAFGGCANPAGTIAFDSALFGDTIILTSPLPTITSDVRLVGGETYDPIETEALFTDVETVLISGDDMYRVLDIANADVEIIGLIIRNGNLSDGNLSSTLDPLALTEEVIEFSGAGIRNRGGSLSLENVLVSQNETQFQELSDGSFRGGVGGGIYNSGTLEITGSAIVGNASLLGLGIYNDDGALTISTSEFNSNIRTPITSAAIEGSAGQISITDTFFDFNDSLNIRIFELSTANVTLNGNTAGAFSDTFGTGCNSLDIIGDTGRC